MAFADPQSVTISGVTTSLPRVSNGENTGAFKSNDGTLTLSVASSYGKRTRQTARLSVTKVSADPFLPSTNVTQQMACYLVCDRPVAGWTVAEAKAVVDGFLAILTASSGAKITQLLGGEN